MSKLKIVVVRRALKLIADEKRWCRHHLALSKSGEGILPHSRDAVQWCCAGSIIKAVNDVMKRDDSFFYLDLFCEISGEQTRYGGEWWIGAANDRLGHSTVIEIMDRFVKNGTKQRLWEPKNELQGMGLEVLCWEDAHKLRRKKEWEAYQEYVKARAKEKAKKVLVEA